MYERRFGEPRGLLERVQQHYQVDPQQAQALLKKYGEAALLPQRGSRLLKEVDMNLLDEAARIAAARFSTLATSVNAWDPIKGNLTWKNNSLTPRQNFHVGYGFGTYEPTKDSFAFVGFTVGGVTYVWGSVLRSPAPAQGSSKTDTILSYALDPGETMTFDAYCFIAAGTLGAHAIDYGHGARVVGWKWEDFQKLIFAAAKPFVDVLTVSPAAVKAAEISAFIVAKG